MDKSKIARITLYLSKCYGCDRWGKFDPLHMFIIRNEMPLDTLLVKRIALNPKWKAEAEKWKLEMPFVVIETNDDMIEAHAMTYDKFLKKIKVNEKVAKRKKAMPTLADSGAVSKDGNETKTPSTSGVVERAPDAVSEPEVEDGV